MLEKIKNNKIETSINIGILHSRIWWRGLNIVGRSGFDLHICSLARKKETGYNFFMKGNKMDVIAMLDIVISEFYVPRILAMGHFFHDLIAVEQRPHLLDRNQLERKQQDKKTNKDLSQ